MNILVLIFGLLFFFKKIIQTNIFIHEEHVTPFKVYMSYFQYFQFLPILMYCT